MLPLIRLRPSRVYTLHFRVNILSRVNILDPRVILLLFRVNILSPKVTILRVSICLLLFFLPFVVGYLWRISSLLPPTSKGIF